MLLILSISKILYMHLSSTAMLPKFPATLLAFATPLPLDFNLCIENRVIL